jgi:hypothetical protein
MVYHNLPKKHFVLHKVKHCGYCNAKRFPLEGRSFCCRQGKVKLHMSDVPDELQWLFLSQTDRDAPYFRKHIRYFNSHFSFANLGANLDWRYNTPKGSGVYTFQIHGQVYHQLDQLVHGQECHTHFLWENQVLIACMTQDQLFYTYGQKCSQITKCPE